MSAWKYKSLMPKVLVAKSRLIDSRDLTNMAGRDLDTIFLMLANTPYQKDISQIPREQFGSLSLETALIKNFLRTCKEIADCAPRGIRSLLSTVQTRFEANAVKAMLRAREANITVDEAMEYIVPVGRFSEARCRIIFESSETSRDIIDALSDTEYGAILKEKSSEYEGIDVVPLFESALDGYVYGKVWKAVGRLRGLDGKIARTIIGMTIDSLNIKTILRCKLLCISPNHTRRYLFPMSEVFGEKDFENAISAVDVKSSIETLYIVANQAMARDYLYVLKDLLNEHENSKSLSQLETVLDRGLLKTSLRMLKRYTQFFNIGLVLAFLNLKWFEIRNLRALVKGTEGEISQDNIRKLLVLPD